MAQPLDPLAPVLPPRPPLRHRVPGQGSGKRGRREEDGADADDAVDDSSTGVTGSDTLTDPDRTGDDDHLIDDYA